MSDDLIDVVVVGAGLSGAVASTEFAKAGLRVVCLEQGDWPSYERGPVHDPVDEYGASGRWERDPNDRGGGPDYPIDTADSDIAPLVWSGVGGGSVLYLAKWNRMTPSDFRVRSHDGVADDWPISYEDLEPYYVEAERQFQVSGLPGDPSYPPGDGPPNPPMPLRRFGARVASALERLGWSWWPGASASSMQPGEGPSTSTLKSSTDITHWPQAIRLGVDLRTHSRVRRVLVEGGRASGVEYIDGSGSVRSITAPRIVLCANGIGTPRILLLSATDDHPAGMANSSGLVGKRLMMHPFAAVAGVFEEDVEGAIGPLGQQIQSMHFYESDASRGFVRGAKWGLQPSGGPLAVLTGYPWYASGVPWGADFHASLRARLRRSAVWTIIGEDLPSESNRVTLSADLHDSDGLPAPKVTYRADDNTRALLDFHVRHATRALVEAGAIETFSDTLVRETGWHLMGTARMGESPATSVTDQFGRTHDIDGLYVFDSSIWVTSGGVNPAATQAALALRCAAHLIQEVTGC